MPATSFDPIASPTVAVSPTREPQFVHDDEVAAATTRLDAFRARTGRGPNLLVILMDDVGWGDFGCYGGGVAVGAPTPNIDRLARRGPAADVVLLGAVVHAVAGVAADRPAADAPRPPAPADVRRARRAAGRGHARRSSSSDAGYVTQAVGKWHIGENVESQPQNVGFDDFYGFLSRVGHVHASGATRTSSPRSSTREARTELGREPCRSTSASCTPSGAARSRTVEEVTIPVLSLLDDKWCEYSERLHAAHGRRRAAVVPATTAPAARTSTTTRTSASSASSPAKHPYKDTIIELDDIVGRLVAELEETGQARGHADLPLVRQRAATWRPGPTPRTRRSAAPKGSTWEGGVRVPGIVVVAGHDRGRPGQRRAVLASSTCCPTMLALAGAERQGARRPLHRRRRPDVVPARARRPVEPQVPSTTGCGTTFSALRVGEYKFMLASTSDDDTDVAGPGGFTGVTQNYTYARFYNLYLDPKEQHSYLTRKLAYNDAFINGIRDHLMSYRDHPPKNIV